jgi:hypothetical protein
VIAGQPAQPAQNVPIGWSATWKSIYATAAVGQAITVPYHDVKVTDPARLAHMTQLYTDYRTGGRPDLPEDIREVLLPQGLVDMGFSPPPEVDGRALLIQQCQQCHHSRLDPTISRERFLVDQLDQMSRDEKDLAIQRINTAADTRLTMPPPLFRLPTAKQRELMIEVLSQ